MNLRILKLMKKEEARLKKQQELELLNILLMPEPPKPPIVIQPAPIEPPQPAAIAERKNHRAVDDPLQPKTCSDCNQVKQIDDFYSYSFKKDYKHKICKDCYYKKYRAEYIKKPKGLAKLTIAEQDKFKALIKNHTKVTDIAQQFNISIGTVSKWKALLP